MGKKDWSHLRNEHKSRFAKRQLEEETSLVKSSTSTNQSIENRDEWLEDTLLKETEVIESFLIFYYKLSDAHLVTIHFGSNRTISEMTGLKDSATSTSP